jgi:hypothetical protein
MSVYRPDARERPHLRPAHGIALFRSRVTTLRGQTRVRPRYEEVVEVSRDPAGRALRKSGEAARGDAGPPRPLNGKCAGRRVAQRPAAVCPNEHALYSHRPRLPGGAALQKPGPTTREVLTRSRDGRVDARNAKLEAVLLSGSTSQERLRMNRANIPQAQAAVERAVALAAAAADPADPDLDAKIEAELNAALADVEAGSIDLDELVASLASIAGYAIDEAARLRIAPTDDANARNAARDTILRAASAALEPAAATPESEAEAVATVSMLRERRSELDRRVAERRHFPEDSPAARINRWLYGERRKGVDNRSGSERRAVPPSAEPGGDEG